LFSHNVDLNSETFTNDFDQIAPSSMYIIHPVVLTHCLFCTPVGLCWTKRTAEGAVAIVKIYNYIMMLTQLRTIKNDNYII